MVNKALISTVIALLIAIAGYVGYLAWDRHQHNLQEEAEQKKELAFDAAFLGVTPEKLAAERKAKGINAASDDAEAKAAGLK